LSLTRAEYDKYGDAIRKQAPQARLRIGQTTATVVYPKLGSHVSTVDIDSKLGDPDIMALKQCVNSIYPNLSVREQSISHHGAPIVPNEGNDGIPTPLGNNVSLQMQHVIPGSSVWITILRSAQVDRR